MAAPIVHGGAPAGWLDLSVNLAPHGIAPEVASAIRDAPVGDYASLDRRRATVAVARATGVEPPRVLLTAGATEALRLVFEVLVAPGDTVAVLQPSYGEYARLVRQRGATLSELPADARVTVVCDPNNPTGLALPAARLARLAARSRLVVDASFAFVAPRRLPAGAIVVRSLTKRLAAPGIRLGYIVAPPRTIARLADRQDPWTVGAHALAAARAFERWGLPAAQARELVGWRERLRRELARRGWRTRPSATTFVLADVGPEARRIVRGLAARRIAVRWCASFGLPDHVRVAVRPPDEQDRFLAALDGIR